MRPGFKSRRGSSLFLRNFRHFFFLAFFARLRFLLSTREPAGVVLGSAAPYAASPVHNARTLPFLLREMRQYCLLFGAFIPLLFWIMQTFYFVQIRPPSRIVPM